MKKLIIILLALSTVSCKQIVNRFRERMDTLQENAASMPTATFEKAWKILDTKYCYFEEKGVDWDEVYERYKPEINSSMSDEALFDVLTRMVRELRDGHVYIDAPFNLGRYWDWYLDYPPNFNFNIVERNYLGKNSMITDGGLYARKIGDIGYIYYGSFEVFSEDAMDLLIRKFSGCAGIVFDIRDNEGGYTNYEKSMLSYFTDERIMVGYSRKKNGPGHDSFTSYNEMWIEPGYVNFTKPVIVLTNRSSYSAANTFAGFIKIFPNVTVIGDKTGGGGGIYETFDLPNGWEIGVTTEPVFSTDMVSFEEGVFPDIYCPLDKNDEYNGIDTMIEKAFSLIGKR